MVAGVGFEPTISWLWARWVNHFSTPRCKGAVLVVLRTERKWKWNKRIWWRPMPDLNRRPPQWQCGVITSFTNRPNSNQWEEISSSLPFSGIAAVIALIDFEKCVYLEFRRLRVFSLIHPQLLGDLAGNRTQVFGVRGRHLNRLTTGPNMQDSTLTCW